MLVDNAIVMSESVMVQLSEGRTTPARNGRQRTAIRIKPT
jgi:hypothetical protein